ncbi:Ribokinase-like protein [Tribonema minus]|uniref:Ribokinase-like protein n=1 Tax=Tribonema minus TaxID=303371 RepID=A0A836CG16_9STRA|nr:Ribokinase-like protein [Tribonema minus]
MPNKENTLRNRCTHSRLLLGVCAQLLSRSSNALAVPNLQTRVLCHGELLYDCIALPEAAGFSLEEVTTSQKWKKYAGGAPANVACALAKLGTSAAFAGAVGEDADAADLQQVLIDSGVDVSLVSTVPGGLTRRCMVTRAENGDRTFAGFHKGLPTDRFADCFHQLQVPSPDALKGFNWLVQGTLGLAAPTSAATHRRLPPLLRERNAGVRHLCDVNWRPVFWPNVPEEHARSEILKFARIADVVKLTDEEAHWLFGMSASDALRRPSDVRALFPASKAVLVTGGEKGAAFDVLGHAGFVPPFEVDVMETTGAGDAFTAGFIHAMRAFEWGAGTARQGALSAEERGEVDAAVRFASAVGALSCTGDGAIGPQPSAEAVARFLQSA